MILGVMSDTHGHRRLMHQVAERLRDIHGASRIIHLGDDYEDAEELGMAGHEVRAVPGLWCRAYADPRVPLRLFETYSGVRVACAHADKDLRSKERAADVVLTGHTHEAALERRGASVYMNPGHLSGKRNRGQAASYGLIAIDEEEIRFSILGHDGTLRDELRMARRATG